MIKSQYCLKNSKEITCLSPFQTGIIITVERQNSNKDNKYEEEMNMLNIINRIKEFVLVNSRYCDTAITAMNGGDYYANI